ncbi:MAG: carbonic anhydrase family protein [Polyangiaceae bacterium]|nr:carbonic anhydrase family protein [Polyangiaceae bacterium]
MRSTIIVFLALLGTACQSAAPAAPAESPGSQTPSSWAYGGTTGPEHWGKLAKEYAACQAGRHQSPIDLKPQTAAPLDKKDFSVSYHSTHVTVINNGHTVQATPPAGVGQTVSFMGEAFNLAQFHFHHPSEHTVTGQSFPMELHLVNTNAAGNITVVGVFIQEGAENTALASLFSKLPAEGAAAVATNIDIQRLLPQNQTALTYSGSLTTPPCSEQVNWVVMESPIEMSKNQIAAFAKLFPDNHRPVQELNDRTIKKIQ